MTSIVFALGPIFLLILIGFAIRKKELIAPSFWEPAEGLTYYIFFPALLLQTTANANVGDIEVAPMAFAIVASMVLVAALAVKAKPYLGVNGATFTSVFQGSIRFNTYVGIAAVSSLWGEPGMTLIAIVISFTVPLVNVLCVIVMETYGDSPHRREGFPQFDKLLRAVIRNPLILACLLGLTLNGLDVTLPPILNPLIEILARASLPLGLLCVGAGLQLKTFQEGGKTVFVTSVVKLMILPLVCLICCSLIGVEGLTRDMCVFFCGLPVATSSFVLARRMGGNGEIMSGIITVTTLGAMLSLPLILLLLEML
ncbi:AEC family transporter [Terasakiella sp. A23]|uniref:AEC family transporter n=1 Tax=Terasakiella sp. FCG-A23 TaxID=3080561 RepID=UPI00295385EE|nr:AEC family transporter [Terasakiella sp. A23]MDV7341674.1 AEC family transporter [Terasakiella sp. A23]